MSSSGAEDGGSERGSAEDGDDDVDMSGGGGGGEVRKDGAVTLSLLDVNPMLVCSICDGYFRDAHTIVECLHTYCKQCIVAEFARSTGKTFACPRCGTQLGGNPMSGTLPDRTMQSVVDSILPIFVVRDAAALAEAGGGAIRQRDSGAAAAGGRRKHRHNSSRSHDIRLSIVPSDPDAVDADTMKKLRYLRTSNKIRVAQLKRYLALVLGGLARASDMELSCDKLVLGNEWTLEFIYKTRWIRKHTGNLVLHFRNVLDSGLTPTATLSTAAVPEVAGAT